MVCVAAMMMALMAVARHHHAVHVMTAIRLGQVRMVRGRPFACEMRRPAFHGESRERLNRKAQDQQHDDEEFAPIRHGCEV